MIPISKEQIEPIYKSNILFVGSIEEFESIGLDYNETKLGFDNIRQCFYVRGRDKFGEYSETKIYFYETFVQKAQGINRTEFINKCKEIELDDVKTQVACMFFLDGKKPYDVWEWVLKNTKKDWEWDYVRSLKCKLKKKLFPKVT